MSDPTPLAQKTSAHASAENPAPSTPREADGSAGAEEGRLAPIFGRLLPFRAIRYNTDHPGLNQSQLVATPGEGTQLAPGSRPQDQPYHALHLFPPGGSKSNPARLEPHEQAALRNTLARWWQDGALQREETPSIYLHRLSFTTEDGSRLTRRGFFALLALTSHSSLQILPHEKTLPHRLNRQIQIFEALATQTLPIFLTYSDPTDSIIRRLEDSLEEDATLADFNDGGGQHHRLQKVGGLEVASWLESQFHGREVLIADGHHRFDSLRELWHRHGTEHATQMGLPLVPGAEAFMAVYLTSMDAPGFRVGAIHRTIRQLPGSFQQVMSRIESQYQRVRVPFESAHPAQRILEQLSGAGPASFGFYAHGEDGWDLLYARNPEASAALANLPEELKCLDVTRLHSELGPLMAEGGSLELDYEKDAARALAETRSGKYAAAIFLNPIRPEHIWGVARAGLTMPPKATYFFPKISAGLVACPVAGEQD